METLTKQLSQRKLKELLVTDVTPAEKRYSSETLVGVAVHIQSNYPEVLVHRKMEKVCGKHYSYSLLKSGGTNYLIRIKAHDYLVDTGGIFNVSVLSLVNEMVKEGFTFNKVVNLYN